MSATKGGSAPYSTHRSKLQPKLVHLIAGLRRHQVEEAVDLLLDYIDSTAAQAAFRQDPSRLLAEIRRKLDAYHFALDLRRHEGAAAGALVSEIESILAAPWRPGHEAATRDAGGHHERQ